MNHHNDNYNGEKTSKYKTCMDDIAIARDELAKSKLVKAIQDPLLCDVYCIPSHNHQAFYLQVYGGQCYTLLYAKTYYDDYLALGGSVMYPFHYVFEANKHNSKKGDIYFGMIILPKDHSTIKQLMCCLPKHNEIQFQEHMVLDGQATIVRDYQNNTIITLVYQDANDIKINELSSEQRAFMDNLHVHLESIIGNLLRQ